MRSDITARIEFILQTTQYVSRITHDEIMPTYDYICESCGDEFERFQSISDSPLRKCAKCGKSRLKRLIGAGSGVIFKGSGFYQTDYRSDSYKKAEKSEKAGPVTDTAKGKTPTKSQDTKSGEKTKPDSRKLKNSV